MKITAGQNSRLGFDTKFGSLTNNDKKRRGVFQTKPIDTTGKQWVRDYSQPVFTIRLKKID